jgi:hypothetical protein
MEIETAGSSEILVHIYQTVRRHISEARNLEHASCCLYLHTQSIHICFFEAYAGELKEYAYVFK